MIAAEVGHLELAYDYLGEAALMDLHDLEHNTRSGVHIASLAGAWIAAIAGFGGMRDHSGTLAFTPRLPTRLERLTFRLLYRGRRLKVDVTKRDASYLLLDGEPLQISHHGKTIVASTNAPVTEPISPLAARQAPTQPHGRTPIRRGQSHVDPTAPSRFRRTDSVDRHTRDRPAA